MTESHIIRIGISDMNIGVQNGILRTAGLGSCVGLTIYDARLQIGGMAHVMLPSSDISRTQSVEVAKYADTAIPELIRKMNAKGALTSRMVAKMAGGAQMFSHMTHQDAMRIGPRNVEMCKQIIQNFRIPIVAEDTGGNHGRTIELDVKTGVLTVKCVHKPTREI
jgi:chemotaxis protein CheD